MTESDEIARAARNINALVEALEKIERRGCDGAAATDRFRCATHWPDEMCSACIAHEALTVFRGQ